MRSREERPKKPDRHGKGKIIIMWLLFMPLFAIGVTCGYAMFNKNAYQSYGDSTIQSTSLVTNNSQLLEGSTYIINYVTKGTGYEYSPVFNYSWVSVDWYELGASTQYSYNGFRLAYDTIQLAENGSITNQSINFINLKEFSFTFKSISQPLTTTGHSNMYLITLLEGKLDNVFYYSIDKVQESPLFNWANNNIIYTGMHNMCTTMNITSTFIPFILTYWILISIIYILFDIEFTLLWKLHEKIHDLTQSI